LHYETVRRQRARLNEYRIGDGDRKLIFDFVFGPVDYGEGVQVGLVRGKMGIERRRCGLTLDIYNVALNEQRYKWLVSSRCLSTSGSSFAREVMSVCGVFFKGRDVSSLFRVPDGSMGSGVCSWQDLLRHLGGANMVRVVELEDWRVVLGDSVAYADFNKDSIVVVFSVLKSRKFGQFFVDFLRRGTNRVVWRVLIVGGVEVSYYNVVGFNLYCDDIEVSQKYRPLGRFGCYLRVHLIKRPVYKCLVGLKVAYVVGAPLFLSDFCRPLFDQWFMVCRFLGNPVWLGHFRSAVTEFLGGRFYVNEFLREVGEWTKCFVYVFGRWQEFDGKDFVFDVVLWKRGRRLVVGWDRFMELYRRFDFDAWLRSDPMLSFVLRWFFGVGGPEVKDFSYMLRYLRSGGAGSLWVGHRSGYVAEVVS
jgi:hypothetical protein